MHSFVIFVLVCTVSNVASIVLPRQNGAPDPGDATVANPGLQAIPATAKPDNTFSNGAAEIIGGFPYDSGTIPDVYQPRDIDIPFGRMFHGDLMMFPQGQLNDPTLNTDSYTPNVYDFANQSACGIPDNSYIQMKVAIHPYFLKYAGLDRKPPHPLQPIRALFKQFPQYILTNHSPVIFQATACKTSVSLSGQKMVQKVTTLMI